MHMRFISRPCCRAGGRLSVVHMGITVSGIAPVSQTGTALLGALAGQQHDGGGVKGIEVDESRAVVSLATRQDVQAEFGSGGGRLIEIGLEANVENSFTMGVEETPLR